MLEAVVHARGEFARTDEEGERVSSNAAEGLFSRAKRHLRLVTCMHWTENYQTNEDSQGNNCPQPMKKLSVPGALGQFDSTLFRFFFCLASCDGSLFFWAFHPHAS